MTSPIDHYYEVLDYINDLEEKLSQSPISNGAPVDKIDNKHKLSKHLHEILLLVQQAEREYWESIDVRLDEE
jgi:hypothetical protein|tara:strand:+ start:1287 stop:1502 length:216 start_codon:yes stop_codon:yes gene_type:complete